MLKAKRKTYEGYCPGCMELKKLTFVGENKELGILWLRCRRCADVRWYPVKRIEKTGRILTAAEFKRYRGLVPETIEYSLKSLYVIGQRIHHSVFDDFGVIVKKRSTQGGHRVIVVRFEHHGTRELVEGFRNGATP